MDRVDRGLLEAVDARTKLAGSNRMEILLFSLGTQEIFGINVFKVREVSRTPFITKAPNMPDGVEGLISLRGNVIPVLALAKVMGISVSGDPLGGSMMVTEYSKRTLGFLVHEVDRIIRVEWDKVRAPDNVTSGGHHFITAITELQDGKLVSILDVETILASTFGEAVVGQIHPLEDAGTRSIFSSLMIQPWRARKLRKLSINSVCATSTRSTGSRLGRDWKVWPTTPSSVESVCVMNSTSFWSMRKCLRWMVTCSPATSRRTAALRAFQLSCIPPCRPKPTGRWARASVSILTSPSSMLTSWRIPCAPC
jgi:chemotaxis signal transduction protein